MTNPTGSLSDFVVSQLRTYVPVIWGAAITALIGWGLLPADMAEQAQNFSVVIMGVVTSIWYLVMRTVEPHLPPWLTRIVLGSNKEPAYRPVRQDPPPPSIPRQGLIQ